MDFEEEQIKSETEKNKSEIEKNQGDNPPKEMMWARKLQVIYYGNCGGLGIILWCVCTVQRNGFCGALVG